MTALAIAILSAWLTLLLGGGVIAAWALLASAAGTPALRQIASLLWALLLVLWAINAAAVWAVMWLFTDRFAELLTSPSGPRERRLPWGAGGASSHGAPTEARSLDRREPEF